VRHFQREPRLPDAARSDECDRSRGRITEPAGQRAHVGLAADERRHDLRERDTVRAGGGIAIGRAGRLQQGSSIGGREIERSRKGPNGLWMGTAALSTLQRAHGMCGNAGNRREFFLRKTGSFA
jgi:hypothetical protein